MEVRSCSSKKSTLPQRPSSIDGPRESCSSQINSCLEKIRSQASKAFPLISSAVDLVPVVVAAGWIFLIVQNGAEIKSFVSKIFSHEPFIGRGQGGAW